MVLIFPIPIFGEIFYPVARESYFYLFLSLQPFARSEYSPLRTEL